ncbi:sirohydrochlorin chelatase [Streptomyces monomycini]|uniref:sirohydrochlorin chelatase n=1 Tax=Streptomyces monomycini TaxID=371720 RepID=UPI00067C7AC5|nr:CbiX/SirB N-terminal domain-containing protein [Streptomyces monomycini]
MKASTPPPPPAAPPCAPVPFDSTAQLMTEISIQLGDRLSRVRLRGLAPRPPAGRPPEARRPDAPCPAGPPNGARPVRPPAAPALVAVAHGSRDPAALRTVTALLDRVRELRPGLVVRLGHIELNAPLLPDTLAELDGQAVAVPLLLARGHHVGHDIPAALAGAPHLAARLARPLGPHPLLAEALHARLEEAGARRPSAVVLAAAGSRAPESATDTARTARLLSQRLGGVPVLPAYASAPPEGGPPGTPLSVPAALRVLAARGHRRPALASCFTAPGRFAAQCAAAAPGPAAAPLGDHPALARLVLHRYDQALAARGGCVQDSLGAATVSV